MGGGTFQAVAGTTDHYVVAGNPTGSSTFTITRAFTAGPVNYDFAGAHTLADGNCSTDVSSSDPTRESGEPDHGCAAATATVWYQWTPDRSGVAGIGAAPPGFCLAVYRGNSLGTLTPVDVTSFGLGGGTFQAVAGTTYHYVVAGNPTGFLSTFTIARAFTAGPANDDFAAAQVLADGTSAITGTVFAATRESGEPDHGRAAATATVWYQWTPDRSG